MRRLGRAVLGVALGWCIAATLAAAMPAPADDAIEMSVSKAGFKPDRLDLRKGDTLRLRLTSTDVEHCFAIDAFRIEKRVLPGQVTLAEFTVDRAGEFPFYCCLEPRNDALRGRLIVRE